MGWPFFILVLTAVAGGESSSDATAAKRFATAVRSSLTNADYGRFLAATGTSIDKVLGDLLVKPSNASAVVSTAKFVPHALNAHGLHALRALVTERLSAGHLASSGEWAKRLARRGLVTEEFPKDGLARVEHGDGSHSLQLPPSIYDRLRALFGPRTSINAKLGLPEGRWQTTGTRPSEKQTWMHVDTFQPTYKVWIFTNLSLDAGPFHYVEGSHLNDERKLRWLHDRTRHLVDGMLPREAPLRYPLGPYSESRHGFEGSLRVVGFDPSDERARRKALEPWGFASAQPVLATSPDSALLVIADTSGFHFRGPATGDAKRTQLVPRITDACHRRGCDSSGLSRCGIGCVPRRDPFPAL